MNKLRTALCLLVMSLSFACGSKESTTPTSDLKDVQLKLESVVYAKAGTNVSVKFVEGKGPLQSDNVVLRPERDDDKDVVCSIISVGSTNFEFKLPANFVYGTYKFCLTRGSQLRGFGSVRFPGEDPGPGPAPFTPSTGSTVWGRVTSSGNPVANVVVSDGYEVVKTDKDGYYQMPSKKAAGYVFISVPSGYEVESNGILPVFHKKLVKDAQRQEEVNFTLLPAGDQTNHTMIYLGDMHMANRTDDKTQFRKFTNELAKYVSEHASEKVYAITLGDMTWDLYWYSRSYCFEQYLNEYKGVLSNLQIFHTIGNHDHDMNATGDWDTVMKFRDQICPNYYSFNIGKIHYVVIDNIECTNNPASQTDGGGRHYNNNIVNDVMSWLKKDLSHVEKSSPVVLAMHAPVFTKDGGNSLKNAADLNAALSGYNVTYVTGHSHVCYTIDKSTSIREYNSGAICAAWWWAGKYNPDYNISTDGSFSGYRITTVKGTEQTSYYKSTGKDAKVQFRAYDRNKIQFKASDVPSSAQTAFNAEIATTKSLGDYGNSSSENEVILNVWDWNPKWLIEVKEGNESLSVVQKTLIDPSFFIAYTIPHMKAGNNSVTWHPNATNHMFVVKAKAADSTLEIKVTDDEGRVYTQSMKRPMELKVDNYK